MGELFLRLMNNCDHC